MKWEDIYKKLCDFAIVDGSTLADNVKIILEGELHNKVIILRGENPHPYADVLHAMAEGEEAEFSSDNGGTWVGVSKQIYYCEAYRIKPSEPEFEYMAVKSNGIIDWMTKKEFALSNFNFIATDTKRERKC